MLKHNANNERIKRSYFTYLKEAKRYSETTVDAVAKSLARFELYNKHKDFKTFHYQQAIAFKNHLAEQVACRTGQKLSKATLNSTLNNLKNFFYWLAGQPGYKSRMQYSDADYFNLSEKDARVATARRVQKAPTIEQVKHVIANMPNFTEIERRNRALIAFTLLTGARDGAIATFKLKHVDFEARCVYQDAREVDTKFSKTFTTYFFPVGEEIFEIVKDWVLYLEETKCWDNNDPLFPSTLVTVSETQQFESTGIKRKHWSNATPIRNIFKKAFVDAGLSYFNPHSLRDTLVLLGEKICNTPEEFKAWSQNLGHEKVLTTFLNYGTVSTSRQSEIIKSLSEPLKIKNIDAEDIAEAVFRKIQMANQ